MTFTELCKSLETKIQTSYLEGVSLQDAEKLAAEFLFGLLKVSEELAKVDLDSRMRKSGLKAVKAAVYSDSCSKADKKPTEGALEHIINSNELVQTEQINFDEAETHRDNLERIYSTFREAHVYYRGIAKGNFNG